MSLLSQCSSLKSFHVLLCRFLNDQWVIPVKTEYMIECLSEEDVNGWPDAGAATAPSPSDIPLSSVPALSPPHLMWAGSWATVARLEGLWGKGAEGYQLVVVWEGMDTPGRDRCHTAWRDGDPSGG